jgi:hypothetical protein
MNLQFAQEVIKRFTGSRPDVDGIADWPLEDGLPIVGDFGVVRLSDDAIIVRVGGDWEDSHVIEVKMKDDDLYVARDFGDRIMGGQTADEVKEAFDNAQAFVAGTLPEFNIASIPEPVAKSDNPAKEEDLDYENWAVVDLDNDEITVDAGSDWQVPLRVTMKYDGSKIKVTNIRATDFGNGTIQIDKVTQRINRRDGINASFAKFLEENGFYEDEFNLLTLLEASDAVFGWPTVPSNAGSLTEAYWKSSTAGNSKEWPDADEDAEPVVKPEPKAKTLPEEFVTKLLDEDVEAESLGSKYQVIDLYENGFTAIFDSKLEVMVGMDGDEFTVTDIKGAGSLSRKTIDIKKQVKLGKDSAGDDLEDEFLEKLKEFVANPEIIKDAKGWPQVPKTGEPIWKSSTCPPGGMWPKKTEKTLISAVKEEIAKITGKTPLPRDESDWTKRDVLEATLRLKEYYGSFKAGRQPSDSDLVNEAILIVNTISKKFGTVK